MIVRTSVIAYVKLGGVVVFWAINFLLIKAALPSIGPLTLTFFRFVGAAFLFSIISMVSRKPLLPPVKERPTLALIGVLQIGAVSALSAVGLSLVPPGRASVVIYTMPLWAIPIAYLLNGEKLLRGQTMGVALAMAGLIVFLSPWLVDWSVATIATGYLILVVVAISWAIGACLLRSRKWASHSLTQTFWQLVAGGVITGLVALVLEGNRPIVWDGAVWSVLLFNWFIASGLCFWWWGQALEVMPAAEAGQFVTLVPIVVLFLSAGFFGENLSIGIVASAVLISTGVLLTVRAKLRVES
ncbi:DMT family transporter [Agrobacterium pusense]|uniref:DMT family transporter n=1 Tax=Agrobacterium pusense TaxID=648995 RepID=UPI003FD3D303